MNHSSSSCNTIGGVKLVTIEAAMQLLYGQFDDSDVNDLNLNSYERALIERVDTLFRKQSYAIDRRRSRVTFARLGPIVNLDCEFAFGDVDTYAPFSIQIPVLRLWQR